MNTTPMKRGAKEILIDGYNLIHKLHPSLTSASLDVLRKETETQLLCFQQKTECPITVVYDGKGSPRESACGAPLHIVFTSASKSADHWIIDYVKSLNTRVKKVTIVSSDNEIRRYATAFGATCVKSETFALQLNELTADAAVQDKSRHSLRMTVKEKKFNDKLLSEREVSRWMKLFAREKS
ncbi:MAG: NYN domain-containing protein [Pelodictyon phaeoclathratiforme]